MELNLLPIAVSNNRTNSHLQSYNALDTYFKNCYFEVYQDSQTNTNKVFCIKRAGIKTANEFGSSSTSYPINPGVTNGLGCHTSQPKNATHVYFAVARAGVCDLYYFDGTNIYGIGAINIPSNKRVNFVDIGLPDDASTISWTSGSILYLFDNTGASGGDSITNVTPISSVAPAWVTSTAYTTISTVLQSGTVYSCRVAHTSGTFATDLAAGKWVALPTTDLTRPAYLNNRVFVGDRASGIITQSNAGGYSVFSASEYIVAESTGGKLVDLARYNNFIVAFKEFSMEFFEDVANQNGTVLGRVGQAEQQVGCVHPNTIVDTGAGELIWLATDQSGNRSVKILTNSFQVESIDDPAVSKSLRLTANYDGSHAFMVNIHGKQFYVLTLKQNYLDAANTIDFANITYAYDLDTKLWSIWSTDAEAGTFVDSATEATVATVGRWNVSGACKNTYNTTYVQDYDTGALHVMDDYYTSDKGTPFTFQIQFNGLDFGTWKRKFLNRLTAYCTVGKGLDAALYVGIKRDDGNHNYTGVGPLHYKTLFASLLSDMEMGYTVFALGSGRNFTLTLYSLSESPIRISAINIDYDIGEGYGIS